MAENAISVPAYDSRTGVVACEDSRMSVHLQHGGRHFHVMAYHDAMRHDGPALELAEFMNGELGPALAIVLFVGEGEVLLSEGGLPLPVLTAFMAQVLREDGRIRGTAQAGG